MWNWKFNTRVFVCAKMPFTSHGMGFDDQTGSSDLNFDENKD